MDKIQRIEQLAKDRERHDNLLSKAYTSRDIKKQAEERTILDGIYQELTQLVDVYRRPETSLTEEEYQSYYQKLQPYHHWYIDSMFIGDQGIIHLTPDESQRVTWDEAVKLLPKTSEEAEESSRHLLIAKASLTASYVYDKTPIQSKDETDRLFTSKQTQTFEKKEFYGLHTYGGYHGFFRPDLKEVIRLLNETIRVEQLKEIDRIYITTEPHPTDSIYDNFDRKRDMHRGKTTAWIVKKEPIGKKRKAESSESDSEALKKARSLQTEA